MRNKINSWKRDQQIRKLYCTNNKLPFYDVAANYLPSNKSANIVDIGCGKRRLCKSSWITGKIRQPFFTRCNLASEDEMFWDSDIFVVEMLV
jgi:hypothetical protein